MTATVTNIRTKRPFYRVREATKDDVNFVVSTWVRSSEKPSGVPIDVWFANVRRLARHHAATGRILVACSPSSEGTILGWACGAGDAVAHVYVRHDFRGRGMGRALHRALTGRDAA